MNYRIIIYFIGNVLGIEGVLMLLPCVVALIFHERVGFYFLYTMIVCGVLYLLLGRKKSKNTVFYAKEGFVAVALCWIFMSLFGALPFYISGEIPSFTNALFETISGFTTTGASILENVEELSKCMLIWRSFTHWIGGMGVLVFILAIMPLSGGYSMHLMRAESPGPSVGKLVPRVKETAKILYVIYAVMTVIEFVVLLIARMSWFDALAMSLGTAGTGGFGILADSCASYSIAQQNILTTFMILFGINFNVYYLFLLKKWKDAFKCEEMRIYLSVIFLSVCIISFNARDCFNSLGDAIHHASFTVASIITTCGFATEDFDLWPTLSKLILVLLMFLGACAGSTGGGMKVSRWAIVWKSTKKEVEGLIHPRAISSVRFEGKTVDQGVLRSIHTYMIAFIFIFVSSLLIVSLDGFDLTTNFTAIAATINNIGPGLNLVGPTRNFNLYSNFSKFVMMFDMLAGRLEVFPILVLISPKTWRKD